MKHGTPARHVHSAYSISSLDDMVMSIIEMDKQRVIKLFAILDWLMQLPDWLKEAWGEAILTAPTLEAVFNTSGDVQYWSGQNEAGAVLNKR